MNHEFYITIDEGELINVTRLGSFRIGRGKSNLEVNKIIIKDQSISTNHCFILVCDSPSQKQPFFWVWDGDGTTPSKNKTIFNGTRILDAASERELDKGCKAYHGDFILLAGHRISFIISRKQPHDKNGTI